MRFKLHHWILLAMVAAAVAGACANEFFPRQADGTRPALDWIVRNIAEPMGQIFLRLIFMIALPLVFCALTLGVAGMGDIRRLGRVGLTTLVFTVLLSSIAVFLGVTIVKTLRPGEGLPPDKRAALVERYTSQTSTAIQNANRAKPLRDALLDIIPRNPLQEMVGALDGSSPGGGMLAVMFFSLMLGVGITLAGPRAAALTATLESLYEVVMVLIRLAMYTAPFGVAGLVFSVTALLGFDILRTLGWYVIAVMGGLALHTFGVYSILVALVARIRPRQFFSHISEVLVTGFATSSSCATLPTALRVTEHKLGVHREITNFVLTVGSTANQNGTALYEGITILFLAQVFGVDLSTQQQIMVVVLSVIAGIGTAGIPGGSMPIVVVILQSLGIPGEGIAIILGVDRILDMSRTVTNVSGDIAIAACVDKIEGKRMRASPIPAAIN